MDVEKQCNYWRGGANEDWDVAQALVAQDRARHGLFFAHLAMEKALKALVCRQTGDLPPRTHNLLRLSDLAGLRPSPEQLDVLAEMNEFNLEGRYPDTWSSPPEPAESRRVIERAGEIFRWLISKS